MHANTWNKKILAHAPPSGAFLQSYEWAQFQEAVGKKVVRYETEQEAAQAFVWSIGLGMKRATLPRPALLDATTALPAIIDLCKKEGAMSLLGELSNAVRPDGALTHKGQQPPDTLLMDLTKSEEELRSEMHEKTRYNIRLAKRKGVIVTCATDSREDPRLHGDDALRTVWPLFAETAKRDGFRLHDRTYYQKMLSLLAGDPTDHEKMSVQLFIASVEDRPIAVLLLATFGTQATYLHGASSHADRALMAPYALQWEVMMQTKQWGYTSYDFWGIAPAGEEMHPLAGVTRFKKGFGGKVWSAAQPWELPLRPGWYTVYQLLKKLR